MINWQIVLSSVVLSSIVSSIATYVITTFSQKQSFKNDYYKLVIDKRMDAYQYIDSQLRIMKMAVLDDDGRLYHSMFYGDQEKVLINQKDFIMARTNGIWLSADIENAMSEMNKVLYEVNGEITDDVNNNILVAKQYYTQIASAREKLEIQLKKDLLTLYDVPGF